MREVASAVSVPFLGIGGIDATNAGEVIAQGAVGAAVITAITTAEDPAAASADLLATMQAAVSSVPAKAM